MNIFTNNRARVTPINVENLNEPPSPTTRPSKTNLPTAPTRRKKRRPSSQSPFKEETLKGGKKFHSGKHRPKRKGHTSMIGLGTDHGGLVAGATKKKVFVSRDSSLSSYCSGADSFTSQSLVLFSVAEVDSPSIEAYPQPQTSMDLSTGAAPILTRKCQSVLRHFSLSESKEDRKDDSGLENEIDQRKIKPALDALHDASVTNLPRDPISQKKSSGRSCGGDCIEEGKGSSKEVSKRRAKKKSLSLSSSAAANIRKFFLRIPSFTHNHADSDSSDDDEDCDVFTYKIVVTAEDKAATATSTAHEATAEHGVRSFAEEDDEDYFASPTPQRKKSAVKLFQDVNPKRSLVSEESKRLDDSLDLKMKQMVALDNAEYLEELENSVKEKSQARYWGDKSVYAIAANEYDMSNPSLSTRNPHNWTSLPTKGREEDSMDLYEFLDSLEENGGMMGDK